MIIDFLKDNLYLFLFLFMFSNAVLSTPPSEAILAGSAFLISEKSHENSIMLAFIVALFANLLGITISYYIGYLFRDKILRFTNRIFENKFLWIPLSLSILIEKTENGNNFWIFYCRFLPGIRSIASIPAGMGRMKIDLFLVFSAAGCSIWIFFWLYFGVHLYELYLKAGFFALLPALAVIVFVLLLGKHMAKKVYVKSDDL